MCLKSHILLNENQMIVEAQKSQCHWGTKSKNRQRSISWSKIHKILSTCFMPKSGLREQNVL